MTTPTAWMTTEERGTDWGIRFVLGLTRIGRTPARMFVAFLMFWYTLSAADARRASRQWLRATGHPAHLWGVYRHLRTFGLVTLDRLFLAQGRHDLFELVGEGSEQLQQLARQGRGALLLGGHIGSYEAMRIRSASTGLDVYAMAWLDNAQKFMRVISALAPQLAERIIPIDGVASAIRAADLIDGGAMVALLGDRVGVNGKAVSAPFLGRDAPFPTGPYLLAASIGCPVYFVQGIYLGGNRYRVRCEKMADRVVLPRGPARAEALQEYVNDYARRLQGAATAHPLNWFNFHDFWQQP